MIISCNSNNKKSKHADYSINKEDTTINLQLKDSYNRGKLIYIDMCVTCHMSNGKGAPKIFPPLAQSDYLKENQKASIRAIKKGLSGQINVNEVTYNNVMTSLGLSDDEVADVMNYINNSWGNNYGKIVTKEDVTKVIKN